MNFLIDYASPSAMRSTAESSWLDLRSDHAAGVRFRGTVKQPGVMDVRTSLRALGELIWSEDYWYADGGYLDPIVTVHDDRVFFEAFSMDQSAFGCVIFDRELFHTQGEVRTGTTNVDFTAWLWAALGEMRSSRETTLSIGTAGVEVATAGGGARFEKKVELPTPWVRGLLQVHAAAAMPGTRLSLKPVDLLSAIRYLRYTKARVSPRALRYELVPNADARLILEPFEHEIPLRGATHGRGEFRAIRTWGRRRLRLIEPLLPFATHVDVYLKGRALPSFYVVHVGEHCRFVLGLTGWSARGFGRARFDMLDGGQEPSESLLNRSIEVLKQHGEIRERDAAKRLQCEPAEASRVLMRLCRRGRALYDLEARAFRHRELFRNPMDIGYEAEVFPPDLQAEEARSFFRAGTFELLSDEIIETEKERSLKTPEGKISKKVTYRDRVVRGRVEQRLCEIKLSTRGRIIFGTCECGFFRENLLNLGPCAHMLTLLTASQQAGEK